MAVPGLLPFLAIAVLSSQQTGCHRLHISPRGNQVRDIHAKIILSCSIEDYDPEKHAAESGLRLNWIGPNTQYAIGHHGRVHTESEASGTIKLYIHRIETTDAGQYSCQLDDDGQIVTETVHLGLFEDIRFHNRSVSYGVRVKSRSVLLECSASGTPVPTVSWRFNKTKLPTESEKYRYEEEGLRIYDVTLDDNGTYECRAEVESQGSLKMRSIHLDVMYPPVISEPPRVVGPVVKGTDAVLRCQADGNPSVKYEWYLERRMSEFVKAKVPMNRAGRTLTIQNFGSENEGRYFCRVSNSVGTKESHVDVTMLVPPSIKELGSHVTVEGRTLILPCEVIEGRPSPDLFWSKASGDQVIIAGGQLLEAKGEKEVEDGMISVDNAHHGISKLIIKNVRRSHSGDYLCQAINAVGNSTKLAKISVDYSPEINSSFTEVFGWSGQTRSLTCTADGQPSPAIAWFSRGQHIFDTTSYQILTTRTAPVTSTLQITIGSRQSWLFGNYSCVAKNSHGSASVAFHLREGEVPDLPHNVSVLKVGATKAVLLAAPPMKTGGIALTSWKVKYESIPGNTTNETIFDHIPGELLMTMTISRLRPSSDYAFHLSAGNEVGFGEAIKFLVKTNENSVLDEKAEFPDVPRRSSAAENTWKDPEALEKAIAEGSDDPDGGGKGGGGRSSTGGAVLGVFSVLTAMALLAVGGVFVHRRRRGHGGGGGGGMEKWFGLLFGKKDPPEKEQPQSDEVIQMGEVAPADDFLTPPAAGPPLRSTGTESTLKATDSFESGFDGLSPRPPSRRVFFSPQDGRSLSTATPMSVRRLGGDQTWAAGGQTHGSTDDLSSGVGTAEPESIQSDVVILGPDDEAGIARGMLAQHDPDLDSIPDIEDDDDDDDLGQL